MKKIIIAFVSLLLCSGLMAQNIPMVEHSGLVARDLPMIELEDVAQEDEHTTYVFNNPNKFNIYVATQPFDMGFGIRCDIIQDDIGFYWSMSYGNGGLYRRSGVTNHIKNTFGIMFSPVKENDFFVNIGLNYHSMELKHADDYILDSQIAKPYSFELGVTREIIGKFIVGLRTDILRWEPCVDFGIMF